MVINCHKTAIVSICSTCMFCSVPNKYRINYLKSGLISMCLSPEIKLKSSVMLETVQHEDNIKIAFR